MPATEAESACSGPAAVVDADGRLIGDVPCVRCGYNLRTQAQDGVCPECTTPVTAALRADLLRFSDAGWLRRVDGGLILCAVHASLTLVTVGTYLLGPRYFGEPPIWIIVFYTLISVLTVLMGVIAVYRATAPEPGSDDLPSDLNVRTVARLAALGVVAALELHMGIWFGHSMRQFVSFGVREVAAAATALAFGTQMFCLFTHIGRLARRVPKEHRPRLPRALAAGFVISTTGAYLASLVDRLPSQPSATHFSYAVGTLAYVLGPLCLLASIPTFVWAARAIRGEARVAERLRH